MQTELIRQLNQVLNAFPEYWDNERLQRSKVINDIKERKPDLIKALINNAKIKSLYGTEIDSVLVFDFHALTNLLQYKEYWADSFTKYRNSVGLTSEGKYLNYNSDVVLDFPFKDCVLEGGMTQEEQAKDEVYYNEIIARDEIDRLFSPKVLTNAKRYTNDGVEENITDFSNEDNLIIKGNNLIALHSLKERYVGKVKLIYIDPPYNTGNDSFKYNDRFNHSTWLTFMKNRLEVARELLSDDGVIAINIDDYQMAYLKILLDDIFNKINFIANMPRVTKKGGKSSDIFAKNHDYILFFSKNNQKVKLYPLEHNDEAFKYADEYKDTRGLYKLNQTLDYDSLQYSPSLDYVIHHEGIEYYAGGDYELHKCRLNGKNKRADWAWRWSKDLFEFGLKNGFIVFKSGGKRPRIYTKTYQNAKIVKENNEYKIIYQERTKPLSTLELTNNNYSNDNATKHATTLFNDVTFDYTKPETILSLLMKISTKPNDIILDFHLGSGTTAAVAHKMGRRYIGVEQMDYINDITVPRLQKVIEGEQGGISKDVNWQGGGNFVYAELKELNYTYIHQIQSAESYDELAKLFEVMKQTAHLNYQIELDRILNDTYEVNGIGELVTFKDLTFDEQKRLLIELLDKNQLYVNADDMNDTNLKVSEQDKAFTRSFYGKDE